MSVSQTPPQEPQSIAEGLDEPEDGLNDEERPETPGTPSGKKKKKGKKGKKSAGKPVPPRVIDLDSMPPRERAIQVEMLALAEAMGVRSPPPKPAPPKLGEDGVAITEAESPPRPASTGSKGKKKKKVKDKSKEKAKETGPKLPAPTMFSISQWPHSDIPACVCGSSSLRTGSLSEADAIAMMFGKVAKYKPQNCPVHKRYVTVPGRVHGPTFESDWTSTAAAARVSGQITSSFEDMTQHVSQTVIDRLDLHAMIERYTEVLEKYYPWSSDMAEVFSRRAAMFMALGMYEEVIEDARACLALDPLYSAGRYQLGVALFSLGEYEAAMDEFAKGLTECPGNTSFKLGFEAAQRESRKALVLLPVYPSSPVTTATPSQYSQYSSPSKSIPR